MGAQFKFDRFVVDGAQRQLRCDGSPVEVNSRYLDALLLMVRNPGELITRDRFLDDVWSGIPVTDEALSQCIANLRRTLGDDANRPRFIETVPKHGYRFIAPVEERQVDHLPLPRGFRVAQRDHRRSGAVEAGVAVRHVHGRQHRLAVGEAGLRGEAGIALHEGAEAGLVPERAVLPPAADAHHHQARIGFQQRGGIEVFDLEATAEGRFQDENLSRLGLAFE